MSIETIGEAWQLGWRITARCIEGRVAQGRSFRECKLREELDLRTLMWTRGRAFPISMLDSRLKCPRCGSRRVTLLFDLPRVPIAKRA